MTSSDLPAVNAALNGLTAALLLSGWILIRRGQQRAHRAVMLAALSTSALFLTSYLIYHSQVGSVRYLGQGPLRTLYFSILLSHTVLAASLVVLVPRTVVAAWRGDFGCHRRRARVTLPVWGYVSVTGVVIYAMLYHG